MTRKKISLFVPLLCFLGGHFLASRASANTTNTAEVGCSSATSKEENHQDPRVEGYDLVLSLPINSAATPKTDFRVAVDKQFYTKKKYMESFNNGSSSLEFVPKNETFETWKKIVTLNLFVGKGLSAEGFVDSMLAAIKNKVKRCEILYKRVKDISNGSNLSNGETLGVSSFEAAIQYETVDGAVEVLYMQYHSGPYDCAGIQYCEKLSSWLNDKESKNRGEKMALYASTWGQVEVVGS